MIAGHFTLWENNLKYFNLEEYLKYLFWKMTSNIFFTETQPEIFTKMKENLK